MPVARDAFIGQAEIINALTPIINTTNSSQACLPHLLLQGSYGSGRQTLAGWLANKTGRRSHFFDAAEHAGVSDLILTLAEIESSEILIIKNLDRVSPEIMKALLEIRQTNSLVYPNPQTGEKERWETPAFTIIGIVNDGENLPRQLRDGFSYQFIFRSYTNNEAARIIYNWGRILFPAAQRLAELTGRRLPLAWEVYQSLFEAKFESQPEINVASVEKAVANLELDKNHLTNQERFFLKLLIESGQPVTEKVLAAELNLTPLAADNRKKYLADSKFIVTTPAGWLATLRARLALNLLQPFDRQLVKLSSRETREEAIRQLVERKEESVRYLVRTLSEPDRKLKASALRVISQMAESVFPELESELKNKDIPVPVKMAIIKLLGESRSPQALPVLQRVVNSREPCLRLAAIDSMGLTGQGKAITFLTRLIKKEKEPVQLAAVAALRKLGSFEIILPLKELVNSVPFVVQKAILAALRQVGDENVAELLDKERAYCQNGKR